MSWEVFRGADRGWTTSRHDASIYVPPSIPHHLVFNSAARRAVGIESGNRIEFLYDGSVVAFRKTESADGFLVFRSGNGVAVSAGSFFVAVRRVPQGRHRLGCFGHEGGCVYGVELGEAS